MNNSSFRPAGGGRQPVHPNSPAGGCGPGRSRTAGMTGTTHSGHGALPHVDSPAARHTDWHAALGTSGSGAHVAKYLQDRIRLATSLRELMDVAVDLDEARRTFADRRLLRKPEASDAAVKEVVKDIISERLTGIQGLIFSTAWELVDKDADHAVEEAIRAACWEVVEKAVEHWFGKFEKEFLAAVRDQNIGSLLKACKAAAAAMGESLMKDDWLRREVLERAQLRYPGVEDKVVRKWLLKKLEKIERQFHALSLCPWVAAVRVFFTSTNEPDDAGQLYLDFESLARDLESRMAEFMPPLQIDHLSSEQPGLRAAP
jgi:hypothetical protein